ncbi:TPA: glycosyltransferase [Vibrio parahaemolyticus]|nr:glycosyltransferase [Vibrio parahaemolyticus]
MNNRKILVLQNSLVTSRVFREGYFKKLLSLGYEVVLISPNDCDFSRNYLATLGVEVVKFPTSKICPHFNNFFWFNFNVFKYGFNSDKIICHFLVTFIYALFSLPFFKRKLTVSVEGLGSFFGKYYLAQRILQSLLKISSNNVLFCNENELALIGSPGHLVIGGVGIDLNKFQRHNIKEDKVKRTKTFLYVGRLIRDKGFLDIIEAFKIIISENNNFDFKLIVAGDIYPNNPSSLTSYDIQSIKDEFSNRIEFLGYVKDLVSVYESADFLILPSRREGFPVCVMEASAMGVVSLVYNVPGSKDAVIEGVNGFIISQVSSRLLSEKIKEVSFLTDMKLFEIKKSSIEYARDFFCSDKKSKLFLENILQD